MGQYGSVGGGSFMNVSVSGGIVSMSVFHRSAGVGVFPRRIFGGAHGKFNSVYS